MTRADRRPRPGTSRPTAADRRPRCACRIRCRGRPRSPPATAGSRVRMTAARVALIRDCAQLSSTIAPAVASTARNPTLSHPGPSAGGSGSGDRPLITASTAMVQTASPVTVAVWIQASSIANSGLAHRASRTRWIAHIAAASRVMQLAGTESRAAQAQHRQPAGGHRHRDPGHRGRVGPERSATPRPARSPPAGRSGMPTSSRRCTSLPRSAAGNRRPGRRPRTTARHRSAAGILGGPSAGGRTPARESASENHGAEPESPGHQIGRRHRSGRRRRSPSSRRPRTTRPRRLRHRPAPTPGAAARSRCRSRLLPARWVDGSGPRRPRWARTVTTLYFGGHEGLSAGATGAGESAGSCLSTAEAD